MTRFLKSVFTLLLLTLVTTSAWAQSGAVRFAKTQMTARQALAEIKTQTGYGSAFNGRLFNADMIVKVPTTATNVHTALETMLEGTGFTYNMANNVIFITPAPKPEPVVVAVVPAPAPAPAPAVAPPPPPKPEPTMPAPIPVITQGPVVHAAPGQILHTEPAPTPKPEMKSNYKSLDKYASAKPKLPIVALKMNLLYGLGTLTPNLGLEVGVHPNVTIELAGSYHPWHLRGTPHNNKKLTHIIYKLEAKYWFAERFNGHSLGLAPMWWQFNIGSYTIPLLPFNKHYRYIGNAYGAGINYGYHLMLHKRWGLEFTVGVGAMYFTYHYNQPQVGGYTLGTGKKLYFGPTNVGVNLVFLIK